MAVKEDLKARDHRLYVAAFMSYVREHKLDDAAASELIGVPVHYIAAWHAQCTIVPSPEVLDHIEAIFHMAR
jgi:hypothetical protein